MGVSTFDGIIWGVFLCVLLMFALLIGYFSLRAIITRYQANRRRAALYGERFQAVVSVAAQQSAVLDAVITELAANPATYSMFPESLMQRICAVHDTARQVEKERNRS